MTAERFLFFPVNTHKLKSCFFSQKQKTKNSNLKFVIPTQEGIRIHLHRNLHPVIPAKAGI